MVSSPTKIRRLPLPEIQDGERKTEAAVTFEWLEATTRFQLISQYFLPDLDMTLHVDTVRYYPMLVD